MAFDGNTLYAVVRSSGADTLITVDRSDGSVINVIGAITGTGVGGDIDGIAFCGGTLYGTTSSSLISINTGTGAASSIGSHGVSDMEGLTCDASSKLYGTTGTTNTLYSIASGGSASSVKTLSGSDIEAVALNNWVLPVELVSFEVTLMEHNSVHISWITANEIDNDYFEIHSTLDPNGDFEVIAQISGAGTSTKLNYYESIDQILSASDKVYYYRIEQTDYDGLSSTSEWRVVKILGTNKDIAVFPNPTKDHLSLVFGNEFLEGNLSLFDLTGKKLETYSISSQNKISLNLTNYDPQIFVVRISNGLKARTFKISKI